MQAFSSLSRSQMNLSAQSKNSQLFNRTFDECDCDECRRMTVTGAIVESKLKAIVNTDVWFDVFRSRSTHPTMYNTRLFFTEL